MTLVVRPFALPLILATALALIPGCGRDEEADFTYGVRDEHIFLDPQKISWVTDSRVADCLFEPLLDYSAADLTLEPAAAESWELSDDARTYTFHLRPEARWSNGDPVRASDFVFAWKRAIVPDFAADYTQLMFCIQGAREFFDWRTAQLQDFAARGQSADAAWDEAQRKFRESVGLSAPDDHTLVVTLQRPIAYFLDLCAFVTFMPVHETSVRPTVGLNRQTGMLTRDDNYWTDPKRLVSNGPYRLARRRFKRDLLLVANEHYWNREAMGNGSIQERIIHEPQSALLAYENGTVHWLPDLPTASPVAADLVKEKRADVHLQQMAGVYFYNFNCRRTLVDGTANPLADPRVRRALAMAIDRDTIVQKVTRLNQPVVRSFVPPDAVPGYDPPTETGPGFDPEAAAGLLAEAGYPGGRGLGGLSILYNSGFGHESIAQAIKRMWEQHIGVFVTLEGIEVKAFSQRLKTQDYTICRASWFGDYRDPTTWLEKMMTGNGNNDCAYSNPDYDALLHRAATQTDPAERFSTLREAEALMLADSPMAMIFQYIALHVYDPGIVQGLHNNAWNRWRLEFVKVGEGGP